MTPVGVAVVKNIRDAIIPTEMKNKKLAIFLLFFTAFLGGAMIPLVKIVLKEIPPLTFTFIRFFISTLVFFPLIIKQNKLLKNILKIRELLPLSILPSINIVLFILAIRFTSANLGQMIYVSVPIIVVILAHFLTDDKFSFKKIVGILSGVIGTIVLFISKTVQGYSFKDNFFGGFIILLGAIFFSFYIIFSKKYQKKFSPLYISFSFFLTTTILSLIALLFEIKKFFLLINNINIILILNILIISVLGTSFYYFLQQMIIDFSSATFGSMINFIQPVFTFFWAMILLGEKTTIYFFIASFLIMFGSWLIIRET